MPHDALFVHAWPETVASGTLNPVSARLCRFDPATGVDAILLRAHEVGAGEASRLLFAQRRIGSAHAPVALGAALDFAVVPCTVGEGVVTLGSDGALRLVRWGAGQATPTVQALALWPGFRHLAAVRNGATTELFAYDAASIRIKRATWNGAQLGPASLVFVPPNVDVIEGIDWNHDGSLELVLGTPGANYVQGWNLAPVVTLPVVPGPTTAQVTTIVSHAQAAGDQLVTFVWDGTQTVMAWANATTSGSLSIGNLPVGAVAAYDRDGDGDEDILLGDAVHSVVRVLRRDAAGYTPLVAPLLTGSAAADAGIGAVCGGDIDGDGDGDLVAWNRGTMNVHSLFDATRLGQAPRDVHADVGSASVGAVVALPVTIDLPPALPVAQPAASSFQIRMLGWLADPVTGVVLPQHVVDQELAIDPNWGQLTTTVTFALPAAHLGMFHLQLQVGVVAILGTGERRSLPTQLLHVTNDAVIEARVRASVEQQCTGSITVPGKGDGGGDGNILGTKTGKHDVGVPPE